MLDLNVAVVPGDGIGPEVVAAGQTVLAAAGALHEVKFNFEPVEAGARRYQRTGRAFDEAAFEVCQSADAILAGGQGLPDVRLPDGTEAGSVFVTYLRFNLELYAGVRPSTRNHAQQHLVGRSEPFAITIIRENTEGLYASTRSGVAVGSRTVVDSMVMTDVGVDRIARFAAEWALRYRSDGERPVVTCVDKANVLRGFAFFRQRTIDQLRAYEVDCNVIHADAFCAALVLEPRRFRVCVMENLLGDLMSDLAAALCGSLGLAGAADIGDHHAVFQAAHGSAPTLAGTGTANPIGTVRSAAMLADWLGKRKGSPELGALAADIFQATEVALGDSRSCTPDLGGTATTDASTQAIIANLVGPGDGLP